jgi:hypothetical protein
MEATAEILELRENQARLGAEALSVAEGRLVATVTRGNLVQQGKKELTGHRVYSL